MKCKCGLRRQLAVRKAGHSTLPAWIPGHDGRTLSHGHFTDYCDITFPAERHPITALIAWVPARPETTLFEASVQASRRVLQRRV